MDGVEVRHASDNKGKGLFALRDFQVSDELFSEDPIVCCQFSWNAACGYKACDHCLRPLENAMENLQRLLSNPAFEIPHMECCEIVKENIVGCPSCYVKYCSQDCLNIAYGQYHRSLCTQTQEVFNSHPLEVVNEAWKSIHYPPETGSIMLIPRIVATVAQSANPEQTLVQFMQFCHRTENDDADLIHKAFGDKFVEHVTMLHELMQQALSGLGDIAQNMLTMENFRRLLALVGTNGQGVGSSPLSRWVRACDKLDLPTDERSVLDDFIDKIYSDLEGAVGTFLNAEGVALYSLQSSINHSCVPNAECTYQRNNSRVTIVALRDILEGDEISISYLTECEQARSRHSRQKQLRDNYLFVCSCERCNEEATQPDVTSDEEGNSMSDD